MTAGGTNSGSLRRGDVVQVRSLEEILGTLDADGTVSGLPFMPEMGAFCGRRFRVTRLALKACVECFDVDRRVIDMREFDGRDVCVLEELRCTGAQHDGCQRGCLLFWKTAWLRRVEDAIGNGEESQVTQPLATSRLRTKVSSEHYFCQSTQLVKVTKQLTTKDRWRLCWEELQCGNVGVIGLIAAIVQPIFWKLVARFIVPRHVIGTLEHTPTHVLDLRPGERVTVRSAAEIAGTVDRRGCNRGLRYDRALNRFCGQTFRVRDRLDRIIIESTGKMIPMRASVTLEGLTCQCHRSAVGGCSRKDPIYWREAWLERPADGETKE